MLARFFIDVINYLCIIECMKKKVKKPLSKKFSGLVVLNKHEMPDPMAGKPRGTIVADTDAPQLQALGRHKASRRG